MTLSEDDLIARYMAPLAQPRALVEAHGLRDDCGWLTPAPGHVLVVKTDPIHEGVHFLADDPADAIGWKALAVNVSDLAAKGAEPLAYVMALQLPAVLANPTWLERFTHGLRSAQDAFGMTLLGGDTDRAQNGLSIAVTAFGQAPAGEIPLRTRARAGDRLFVTGTIGDAAMGLHLRTTGFARKFWPLDEAGRQRLIERSLRPAPRLGLRPALRRYATASMDVSDGLLRDADKLCRASALDGTLRLADVPLSEDAKRVIASVADWNVKAVTGGDDYEVLCAVAPENCGNFKDAAAAAGIAVTEIGALTVPGGAIGRCILLDTQDRPIKVESMGWSHF